MVGASELLQDLLQKGVILSVEGERLRVNAPKGVVTPVLQAAIVENKGKLLKLLQESYGEESGESLRNLSRDQPHPLSISQERLWDLMQISGDAPLNNMYLAFKLCGDLDITALEKSLQVLVERHEPLRTQFIIVNGTPAQWVQPSSGWMLTRVDMTDFQDRENRLEKLITGESAYPFDPIKERLLRVNLVQMGKEEWVLILVMHHLISDGWSWDIFLRELSSLYSANRRGESASLPPLPIQYIEYAVWQREFISSERYASQLKYWEQTLRGIPALELPVESTHASSINYAGSRAVCDLQPGIGERVRKFSRERGATPFMTLLAAFKSTIHRITKQSDLVIGTPIAARHRIEFLSILGYFNNLLPMRTTVSSRDSFLAILDQVRDNALSAYNHADVPLHRLADAPYLAHISVTRAIFAMQDTRGHVLTLQDLRVESLPVYNQTANFDLFLTAEMHGDDLRLIAEYRTHLFGMETIQKLLLDYTEFLVSALETPERSIQDLLPTLRSTMPARAESAGKNLYQSPISPLEIRMAALWEETLQRRPIGVLDNFFDLGGHSLLALRLFGRIQKEFNIHLPLATLLKEPTIRHLTGLIEGEGKISWASLVAIQPKGTRPPFFGVHGMDGNVLFWRNIAQHLGTDQPFFGLQSRGMDGKSRAVDSIPRMAQLYLDEIRTIQPQGPYHLGGYSLGGEIAFEMAQQLCRQGEQVALLVMFDTSNPVRSIRPDLPAGNEKADSKAGNAQQLLEIWRRKLNGHLERLKDLTLNQKISYLMKDGSMRVSRLRLHTTVAILRWLGVSLPSNLLYQYLREAHIKAVTNYIPEIYPGRLTIFRASESLADNPPDSPMGWNPLATNGIDLMVFDGKHADVYSPEHAPKIAEMLKQCLSGLMLD